MDQLEISVDLFKTLSEPNRVRILMMLRNGEMCVCEITKILKLDQSTVSRHLARLKSSGLIRDERRGKWIYCRLAAFGKGAIERKLWKFLSSVLEESDIAKGDLSIAKEMNRAELCR